MTKLTPRPENFWKTSGEKLESQPAPISPYFAKAYDFMELWQNGKQEFSLQTSGSTGPPKSISVTRQQLTGSALMTGKALNLGKGSRALVCLNINYVAGLMMLVRGMELGWELTIVEPASNPFILLPPELSFDFVAMVPLQLSACLENPETEDRVQRVEKILLGGAPVDISLSRKISNLKTRVFQSYGMTETVSHIALRGLNGSQASENYHTLPGVTIGVDDRNCLFVSGAMTNDEIVQTNDLVELVSISEFKWIGRFDNVINSGGVKLFLDQLDEKIAKIFLKEKIATAFFCWFETDEKLGQKLILVFEKTLDGLTGDQVLVQIRKKLSTYETPKHVYFADRFVKTATDKIDRRQTVQLLLDKLNG